MIEVPILLDTCAAIWLMEDGLSSGAVEVLNRAHADGLPLHVSPITAWEIGLLVSRNRLSLAMTPQGWFASLLKAPGVLLAEMPPDILVAANFLPGAPPRDPADRIIAASARGFGLRLMTRDRLLLAYAEQGHLSAVAC